MINMVFKKLSENIDENQYYNKYKVKNSDDEKVNLHIRISPEIANNITKTVAIYRDYGIDKRKLTKSDLSEAIFKEYFDNMSDDESAILSIFSKVKAVRDVGVA